MGNPIGNPMENPRKKNRREIQQQDGSGNDWDAPILMAKIMIQENWIMDIFPFQIYPCPREIALFCDLLFYNPTTCDLWRLEIMIFIDLQKRKGRITTKSAIHYWQC